jgi:hypothetical protein
MSEDGVPFAGRELGESGGDGISVRALEHLVLRCGGRAEVDQLVFVAAVPLGLTPLPGDQVSGRHDRIRDQRAGVEPASGRHHPEQRFLDHVLDALRFVQACANDSAEHRSQLDDVGVLGARPGLLVHRSLTPSLRNRPITRHVTPSSRCT